MCSSDLSQVQRHKELLRSEHKWRRENSATKFVEAQAQSAENGTRQAAKKANIRAQNETRESRVRRESEKSGNGKAKPEQINEATFKHPQTVQTDVRSYINASLPTLERFVRRELRYRESSGRLVANLVSAEEVIDEAVVTALSSEEKPSNLTVERWLYRLAIQAINRIALGNGTEASSLPLEQHVGSQNVTGSDEDFLQFHQPGETFNRQDMIADRRASNPEELAASDEVIDQLEMALHGAKPAERESFVLFAIEGFSVDEISQVTDRRPEAVRNEISGARNQLMKKLPAGNLLKQKLMKASEVA